MIECSPLPRIRCQMSHAMCCISRVTCHVSRVTCHICYQRGPSRLVTVKVTKKTPSILNWSNNTRPITMASYIWDKMCRKNSDTIQVLFSPSLWLQSALLCDPGSLELVCSWTTPQCESPQVTSLAKSKCHYIFWQLFFNNFKRSLLLNR